MTNDIVTYNILQNIDEYWRDLDSEYRMLAALAAHLGAKPGDVFKNVKFPNIKGEIKIVSERVYCSSCLGVIQEFNTMFPKIKLILVDGAK